MTTLIKKKIPLRFAMSNGRLNKISKQTASAYTLLFYFSAPPTFRKRSSFLIIIARWRCRPNRTKLINTTAVLCNSAYSRKRIHFKYLFRGYSFHNSLWFVSIFFPFCFYFYLIICYTVLCYGLSNYRPNATAFWIFYM